MRRPRSIAAAGMGVRHAADPRHRPILGLVGSRLVAYLGHCRVKAAKLLTERFGAAPTLFSIDGGRYLTTQQGLALALAPGGLEVWNGPDAEGGRVTLDPRGHPRQCRSLVDHSPDAIVAFGADDRAGGTYAADCSHVER